jgi:hypothetical protein
MLTVGRDEQRVNLTSFAHTRPTCEHVKPYLDIFDLQLLSATRTWHSTEDMTGDLMQLKQERIFGA